MRDATRADRPKGAEAQCTVCWRIFSRYSNADRHMVRKTPVAACHEPSDIGMVCVERRGLKVWQQPGGDWRDQ